MSNKSVTDELTTVAGIASAVAQHAMTYGIDIYPICKSLEIDPAIFQTLTGRISIDRLSRLLEACALLSNDDAFGLKCAGRFVAGSTGPFGYGLMAAPSVRHFLQFLEEHVQYATFTSYFHHEVDARGAKLTWTFSPIIVKRDQYVDMSVTLVVQRLRDIVGVLADQIEIELERPKPRQPTVFRDLLSRRVAFGCRMNSIRVPLSMLDMPNPKGDIRLFDLMDMQCRTMRPSTASPDADFVDQVRRYLTLRIAEPNFALGEIAPYFGVSDRTFQRRLAEHNTSLNVLRDEVRRDLSLNLLTESDLPISEICYRLGYSAPSAFTRSVTRWFGETPRNLRDRKSA